MEARSGEEGRREFIQVLRLCERSEQSFVEWARLGREAESVA